jgi:spermidine synthase
MRPLTPRVAALLFGSGFCALVYQVGWLRNFRLIFGASTAASAAVLAIFIGGLGIGSIWLGPKADRHPRPLLFYSHLESIIAVSAAASPLLLMLVRQIYLASGGTMRLGMALSTFERLILSVFVLAVPTIAMGGTLPAAARAVTRSGDVRRHDVAVLYGVNTLGAVAGCLIATFLLLERLGTMQTIWLAAAINLLVAIAARQVDRTVSAEDEMQDADVSSIESTINPQSAIRRPQASAPTGFVLVASAIVGFAFFLMELVWYRLLAPLLGGSVFTFGLVLAVALVGIGIGGLLYTLTARDRPATLAGFATSCLLEALAVAGTFAIGDRVAILTLVLVPLQAAGFAARIAAWTIVTTIVVLPAALVAGYQFPMLIALLGRGRQRIGRQVGLTYAANTFGAIIGSLAGGFGILPWLSAPGTWRLVAILLALLGVAAAVLAARTTIDAERAETAAPDSSQRALRSSSWRVLVPRLITAALVVALLATPGPTAVWRHGGIGAGRAPANVFSSPNQLESWRQNTRRWIVWDGDGVESSVALVFGSAGYAFLVNGKSDGNSRSDAGTQVMLGLIGALRKPQPRTAMVVGLGTGSSAGWLAALPTIERVDTVELEPLVIDVAKACEPTNANAMRNPKIQLIIGDARETLLTGRGRYDIIASEPSNPFRAGIASLFTQEFYRASSGRLSDDGVFVQWVQGYEIDAPTLRTIYATMASVFPQVETWQTLRSDIVLLASKRAGPYNTRAMTAMLGEEPFKTAVANAWRGVGLPGVLAHYVAGDGLTRAVARAPDVDLNTDDRNVVEFGLARSVGSNSVIIADLRKLAHQLGAGRPPLDDASGVSWPAVDTARVGYNASERLVEDPPADAPPGELARQRALIRFYEFNDRSGARGYWAEQSEPPRDVIELAMLADIEAESGAETALPYIEQLRAYQPAEADTILAALRLRQGRIQEAAVALEAALVRLRTDPWPVENLKQKAVDLADPIAAGDSAAARRLFDALREPFSVREVENARLMAAADLSRRIDFPGLCRIPIGALEPHPPWNASTLTLRRDCYATTNDSRLSIATRDLQDFYAHEAIPLGSGIPAR